MKKIHIRKNSIAYMVTKIMLKFVSNGNDVRFYID